MQESNKHNAKLPIQHHDILRFVFFLIYFISTFYGKQMLNLACDLLILYNIWAAARQKKQNDCAPSENSDQPRHPPSLIRVFAWRFMGSLGSKQR